MSDITVVGLGPMGAALAKTLQASGRELTVWNRSRDKIKPLVSGGAHAALSVADSIMASPIVIVCVNNYASTTALFGTEDVFSKLAQKTVVQLSTGTPEQALASEKWFQGHGAAYLDGSILGAPIGIGTDEGQILIGGNDRAWKICKPVLKCLAGNFQYTGDDIRSPSILDLAWLSQRLGLYMGVFQGLILCEAGGVGLDVFASTVAADERISTMANTIHNNDFGNPVNTVNVWEAALHQIQKQAQDTEINTEFLDFIAAIFQRAQTAGYGGEDVAALVKVFRNEKF